MQRTVLVTKDPQIQTDFGWELVEFEGNALSFSYSSQTCLNRDWEMIFSHLRAYSDKLLELGLEAQRVYADKDKILVIFNKDVTEENANAIVAILIKKCQQNQTLQAIALIEKPLEPPRKRQRITPFDAQNPSALTFIAPQDPAITFTPFSNFEDMNLENSTSSMMDPSQDTLYPLPLEQDSNEPAALEQLITRDEINFPDWLLQTSLQKDSSLFFEEEYTPPPFNPPCLLNDMNEDDFIRTDAYFNSHLHCEGYRIIKIINEENAVIDVFQIKFQPSPHHIDRIVDRRFQATPVEGSSVHLKNSILTFSLRFPSPNPIEKFEHLRKAILQSYVNTPLKKPIPISLSWPTDTILIKNHDEFNEIFKCVAYRVIPCERRLAIEFNNEIFFWGAIQGPDKLFNKRKNIKKSFSLHRDADNLLLSLDFIQAENFREGLTDFFQHHGLATPVQLNNINLDPLTPVVNNPPKKKQRAIKLARGWKCYELDQTLKQLLGCSACYISKKSILLKYSFAIEVLSPQQQNPLEEKRKQLLKIIGTSKHFKLRLEKRGDDAILIGMGAHTSEERDERWGQIKDKLRFAAEASASNKSTLNETHPVIDLPQELPLPYQSETSADVNSTIPSRCWLTTRPDNLPYNPFNVPPSIYSTRSPIPLFTPPALSARGREDVLFSDTRPIPP